MWGCAWRCCVTTNYSMISPILVLVMVLEPSPTESPASTANFQACESLDPVESLEKSHRSPRKFRKYLLDPDRLNQLACRARVRLEYLEMRGVERAQRQKQALSSLAEELRAAYPGYVVSERQWLSNIAGGALFQISLHACNFKEYLLFFQSPIGTEGYSGRYQAELWDYVIDGSIVDYGLGEFQARVWRPGSHTYMSPGMSQGFKATPGTLVMEYARGKIGSSIEFGVRANFKNLGRRESRAQIRRCAEVYFETSSARRILRKHKRERHRNEERNSRQLAKKTAPRR